MADVAERRNKTLRDMALSMGLIVVAVLVVVWIYGGVSFSPGKPSGGQSPTADVQGGFQRSVGAMGFDVVVPAGIPADWHPNSFSVTGPAVNGAGTGIPAAVRGGWLTPDGAFVTLVESAGTVPEVLTVEIGAAGAATSKVSAGGATWLVAPGRRSEVAWVRDRSGVVFLITGSASAAAFETVAQSVAGG